MSEIERKKIYYNYYQQKELEEKSKELNFVEYKKQQIEQNKLNNNRKQIENKSKKTTILVSSFFIYIVSLYCTMLLQSDKTASGGTKGMDLIASVFFLLLY